MSSIMLHARIPSDVYLEAQALGINLSESARDGIIEAIAAKKGYVAAKKEESKAKPVEQQNFERDVALIKGQLGLNKHTSQGNSNSLKYLGFEKKELYRTYIKRLCGKYGKEENIVIDALLEGK